jgi:hypothetical protein
VVPGSGDAGGSDRSRDVVASFPTNVTVNWSALGGFATTGEYTISHRNDRRPGLESRGLTRAVGFDVSKIFPTGSIAGLREDLRTRVSYRSSATRTTLIAAGTSLASRLTDNGRHSISFTADSDVSDTMILSLSASEVVTFDRNFNRRIVQTIISAVLHIDFSASDFR